MEKREGKVTCGKCGGDTVLMVGSEYIFGIGLDCPKCKKG